MNTVAFSPSLTVSWRAVSTWNTVSSASPSQGETGRPACFRRRACSSGERGRSTVSTPPRPSTSPYRTGAEPSTALPFTVTPPLEPRS